MLLAAWPVQAASTAFLVKDIDTASASGFYLGVDWQKGGEQFTLRVAAPNAAFGTRYPVKLTMTVYGSKNELSTRTVDVEVMIGHQIYLPRVRR